jgi:hypothetical protein
MYTFRRQRFQNYRLDFIKTVLHDKTVDNSLELREKLQNNLAKIGGVSFGGRRSRSEIICMKLQIDENREQYIIERVMREGQGGELLHISENTFLYTREMFDSSDISPWIKTFIGRIIQLEGTNKLVVNRFYEDVERMSKMYGVQVE